MNKLAGDKYVLGINPAFETEINGVLSDVWLTRVLFSYYYNGSFIFGFHRGEIYMHGEYIHNVKLIFKCDFIARNDKYLFIFDKTGESSMGILFIVLDLNTFEYKHALLPFNRDIHRIAVRGNALMMQCDNYVNLYDISNIKQIKLLKKFTAIGLNMDENYIYAYKMKCLTAYNHNMELLGLIKFDKEIKTATKLGDVLKIDLIICKDFIETEFIMFTGFTFETLIYDPFQDINIGDKIINVNKLNFGINHNIISICDNNYKVMKQIIMDIIPDYIV